MKCLLHRAHVAPLSVYYVWQWNNKKNYTTRTRPNRDARKSECDTKALMIDLMSSESSSRWCVWHTATEFSRVSDIDVRSQVFSLRRALQLRSACADDAGDTISSFTSWPTWSYSARTSGTISRRAVAASSMDETGRLRRNIRSCACKSIVFSV